MDNNKTQEDPPLRVETKLEKINFHAHSGECKYCGGIVKMARDQETLQLVLDGCWCLKCGQRYFVKTQMTVEKFDMLQWRQKSMKEKQK